MFRPEPLPEPVPPHGAPLSVTTGGSAGGPVIVATDALLLQLSLLAQLADDLRGCSAAVGEVLEELHPVVSFGQLAPPAAIEAKRFTTATAEMLGTAEHRAQQLVRGVHEALKEYSLAEASAGALLHQVEQGFAWQAGFGVRLAALPLGLALGTGLLANCLLTGRSPAAVAIGLQSLLKQHGRILTNRATVAVVRQLTANADAFGAGFLLVPPPIAAALDSSKTTGVSSSSNAVVAAGRSVGLFEPTGVSVHKTSQFEFGRAPTSLAARSESFPIPESDPNGEQIRIDRYVEPGKPDRFDVYIAGTVTFDPKTHSQPFDLTSDLNGVGGRPSASYDAVVKAMTQAGVTPESPVVLNGYSQGGLLASQVAASGHFNVHGVVTFGAPSAQVAIPASIPVLTVRNAEDLVPATSGFDTNPHALVVERPVFDHQPVPSDWAVPAHRLSYYQETARVVDDAESPEVRSVLDPLNRFGAGAERVDSTLWVAARVPASAGAG